MNKIRFPAEQIIGFIKQAEARVLIEQWRQFYKEQRPHSAHGYKTPAKVRRNWSEPDTIHPGLTA